MKTSTMFAALGMLSIFFISAYATNGDTSGAGKPPSARCDHAQPKTFTIKVTIGKDKANPPKVDKKKVTACFEDNIAFEGDGVDFTIFFKKDSPFEKKDSPLEEKDSPSEKKDSPSGKNLSSSRGKAVGKIEVNPKGDPVEYKYDVIVPGYPVLDPRIVIIPK